MLQKLRLQQHLLLTRLKQERHEKLYDVEFLQSGVHWIGWMEAQLNKEIKFSQAARETTPNSTESESIDTVMKEIMDGYVAVGG